MKLNLLRIFERVSLLQTFSDHQCCWRIILIDVNLFSNRSFSFRSNLEVNIFDAYLRTRLNSILCVLNRRNIRRTSRILSRLKPSILKGKIWVTQCCKVTESNWNWEYILRIQRWLSHYVRVNLGTGQLNFWPGKSPKKRNIHDGRGRKKNNGKFGVQ